MYKFEERRATEEEKKIQIGLNRMHKDLFEGLTIGNPCSSLKDCQTYDPKIKGNRDFTKEELETPVLIGCFRLDILLFGLYHDDLIWYALIGEEKKTTTLQGCLEQIMKATHQPLDNEIIDAIKQRFGCNGNKDFYKYGLTLNQFLSDDTYITGPLFMDSDAEFKIFSLQLQS